MIELILLCCYDLFVVFIYWEGWDGLFQLYSPIHSEVAHWRFVD